MHIVVRLEQAATANNPFDVFDSLPSKAWPQGRAQDESENKGRESRGEMERKETGG